MCLAYAGNISLLSGDFDKRSYVTVVTSYGDIACHYGDIVSVAMNHDVDASAL